MYNQKVSAKGYPFVSMKIVINCTINSTHNSFAHFILKSKWNRRDFEFEIAVKCPNLAKCDAYENEAMN